MIQISFSFSVFFHLHPCASSHLLWSLCVWQLKRHVIVCLRVHAACTLFGIVASALRSDGKHAKEHEDLLRLLYNPHTPFWSYTVLLNTFNSSTDTINCSVMIFCVVLISLKTVGDVAISVTQTSPAVVPRKGQLCPHPQFKYQRCWLKVFKGRRKTGYVAYIKATAWGYNDVLKRRDQSKHWH